MRLLALAVVLALSALPAHAKSGTISKLSGREAKVGKSGGWKLATVGAIVSRGEYLVVPREELVRVTIDGTEVEIPGSTIIPGARLESAVSATAFLRFVRAGNLLDESAGDLRGTVPVGSKGHPPPELQKRSSKVLFAEEEPRTTLADRAERDFENADLFTASERARAILADKSAKPLERRRASLVLARVAWAEADDAMALKQLGPALASVAKDEAQDSDRAERFRLFARCLRARIEYARGDLAKAKADLTEASSANVPPGAPVGALHATLLLAALSWEEGDVAAAKALAAKIPAPPKDAVGPEAAATELLHASAREILAALATP